MAISSLRRLLYKKFFYPTCLIYPGASLDRKSTLSRYNVLFPGARLLGSVLGDHSYIQENSTALNCEIGKFCSIASHAYLGLPQHKLDEVSSHPSFYLFDTPLVKKFCSKNRFYTTKRTIIGHDVWIGHGALVMAGISIGSGAVIGAGAVVTRDIPAYAIAVGAAARIIRYRFGISVRNRLLRSEWWNMSETWLEKHHRKFSDPRKLLRAVFQYKKKILKQS